MPSIEIMWNSWIRSTKPRWEFDSDEACSDAKNRFYLKVTTALASLTIVTICLPLLVAGTTSFRKAGEICYERYAPKEAEMFSDVSKSAGARIFPGHAFQIFATIVSLLAVVMWMIHSPYQLGGGRSGSVSAGASTMDTQRESLSLSLSPPPHSPAPPTPPPQPPSGSGPSHNFLLSTPFSWNVFCGSALS
jgi:hypothetical protein